jgi:hypothetical protein
VARLGAHDLLVVLSDTVPETLQEVATVAGGTIESETAMPGGA